MNKRIYAVAVVLAGLAGDVYAQDAVPAANPLSSFFPLIVIFAIFYFLIIRPQQKKAKEHQAMINAVKKDDRIITNGGLYATVVGVKGEIIEAKIADNVKVQFAKSSVSLVVSTSEQPSEVVTPEIIKS